MSFPHPLLHVNWTRCPSCAEGHHGGHRAEWFDDGDDPNPCPCSCAGGPAPARRPLPPEPAREPEFFSQDDPPWTEPDPPEESA